MDSNETFCQAKDQFLQSLAAEDRTLFSKCSSVKELLSKLEQYKVVWKNKRFGRNFFAKIKSLSDNLEPYFLLIELAGPRLV